MTDKLVNRILWIGAFVVILYWVVEAASLWLSGAPESEWIPAVVGSLLLLWFGIGVLAGKILESRGYRNAERLSLAAVTATMAVVGGGLFLAGHRHDVTLGFAILGLIGFAVVALRENRE